MTQLRESYHNWLVSQIKIPNNKTYVELFEIMDDLGFSWMVPNDQNRVEDGAELRIEFTDGKHSTAAFQAVSFLEVLIALSRRVAFLTGDPPEEWAWKLLKHIGLTKMFDPLTPDQADEVDEILDRVIWRTYEPSGKGGFFPLKNPREDQTKVEIWYQMNAYVNEMFGT